MESPLERQFHSPTLGNINTAQLIERLSAYMEEDPEARYRLVIGSDSQCYHSRPSGNGGVRHDIDFVSAIVVHRIGNGGIYFWQKRVEHKVLSLHERIYREALDSLILAEAFLEELKNHLVTQYSIEIHVDVGQVGETRVLINEVVGMIRGNGFDVKTKPEAFAAASVADRHT